MKRYMKKLAAAFMAFAMVLSLSVTAFADTTVDNTVTSQGGRPPHSTSFIAPTYVNNDFNVIFDSFGLIAETDAMRYEVGTNNEVDFDPGANFYFKNSTDTVVDTTATLLAGNATINTGDKVVKYAPITSGDTVTTIYAKVDANGKFEKWCKSYAADAPTTADWGSGGAYEAIAAMEKLNPLKGEGLDEIDKINEKAPTLYFQKGTSVTSGDFTAFPYTFIPAAKYDTNSANWRYALVTDNNGTESVTFLDGIGTAGGAAPAVIPNSGSGAHVSATTSFAPADPSDTLVETVQNAKVSVTSGGATTDYYRQRTYTPVLSLNTTSSPLKVINKTDSTLGVTMTAKLTNIPGGDGTKQTFVYAKDMVSVNSGGAVASGDSVVAYKFYDGTYGADGTKEIVGGNNGVPVIYMEMACDQEETKVMTYDSTKKEGSISISTTVAPVAGAYAMLWNGQNAETGNYAYGYANDDLRERDFNSVTFNLKGGIDAENKVWADNTIIPASGESAPKLLITWSIGTFEDLLAPSLTAAAWVAKRAWVFTSDKNKDEAAVKKVTFVYTGGDNKTLDGSEVTYAKNTRVTPNTETFTIPVAFMTANPTKPNAVVFTFYDKETPYRTVDVTIVP